MRELLEPYHMAVVIAVVVQLILFVRGVYRRIRNDELMRAFVEDMATSHLPHIYELLARLCDQQGIPHEPLPPIRWFDLDGQRR